MEEIGTDYAVFPIEGAARDVGDVIDDIQRVYSTAAKMGGRVIAGHTLACSVRGDGGGADEIPTRGEYLFLVIERPD